MNKKLLSLSLLACLALSANALDFSIGGSGTTQTSGAQNTQFGADLRLEQFVTPAVSVGAIQSIAYSSNDLRGATDLFSAYNINYKVFGLNNTVFAGVSTRVGYGDSFPTWTAGPLIGNRLFIKENVYVLTQVNYDVGLNRAADNTIRYSLGLGVRF